jgi:hypothetical protein
MGVHVATGLTKETSSTGSMAVSSVVGATSLTAVSSVVEVTSLTEVSSVVGATSLVAVSVSVVEMDSTGANFKVSLSDKVGVVVVSIINKFLLISGATSMGEIVPVFSSITPTVSLGASSIGETSSMGSETIGETSLIGSERIGETSSMGSDDYKS